MRAFFITVSAPDSRLRPISVSDSARGFCTRNAQALLTRTDYSAAFDHDFGAVTESTDPLMQSYTHLM